jgi:hypothetical protein
VGVPVNLPVNLGSAMAQTVLSIQNMGTSSGCVGFFSGADVTGLSACPGGFTGDGGTNSPLPRRRRIGELPAGGVHDSSKLILVFHNGSRLAFSTDSNSRTSARANSLRRRASLTNALAR